MSDLLIAFIVAAAGAFIIFMIGFYVGRLTEQKAAELAESARRTADEHRRDELIPVTRAELIEAWRNHQGCT